MSLRRTQPLPFSPTGCSDALDATNVFSGAMLQLRNLIPDPTTKNLWQCRPAAFKVVDFAALGFLVANTGFVSVLNIFGNYAIGLISTTRNTAHDEPFMYDLLHQQNVPITGVTAANTPATQSAAGPWTPPTCDIIGTKVVFTSPGFDGITNFVGFLDIHDPTTPVWSAGNTSPNALAGIPIAVAQFAGRAWYIVNPAFGQPAAYFSDILLPQTITNGTQILTFGDNVPLTAAFGLPLANQLGGIIQALMVFKGVQNIYQVTGDFILNTLAVNSLNASTGTLAINSLAHTPQGIVFIAPDGLRLIDFDARVNNPIGEGGAGINVPFLFAAVPSRVSTASSADVIRITVQNNAAPMAPFQEWWFDITRQIWTGPHSIPSDQIAAYNDTFIIAPFGVTGQLWQSDVKQTTSSTFVENGVQLGYTWQTCMLPDTKQMSENSMIETTINMATGQTDTAINIAAYDEGNFAYDSVILSPTTGGSIWNNFNWNQAQWAGGVTNALYPRQPAWHIPIVFRRLSILVNGLSTNTIKVGDMFLRYEQLGYLQQLQTSALGPAPGTVRTFDATAMQFDTTLATWDRG